ncbi:MAG: hypothetical protein MJA83_10915 [Gammaproteobacteria bacterium]|nr:hypothetical protein [Gammaproteobacteria bacterium]
MTESEPVQPYVGSWYRSATGETFEVVAIDEDDATVEIQHFDGTVEEIDFDTWSEVSMEMIEPPEDWSGSLDIEREDYGVDLSDGPNEEWDSPLDYLDRAE